jgi:hypothetical protein
VAVVTAEASTVKPDVMFNRLSTVMVLFVASTKAPSAKARLNAAAALFKLTCSTPVNVELNFVTP